MNLHQVLTGAVNPGDNCFSVGSVNSVPFTAYASGCDVVILGSDFERLQIIPGANMATSKLAVLIAHCRVDRLQLPMEALCVYLNLFSFKIKKRHLSL